jgi:hypothetical protein
VCPGPNPCFTRAQIEGLKKVYEGPKNSAGVQLGPQQVFGAEVFAPTTGWNGILYLPVGGDARSANWWKQNAFRPPEPNFDWRLFNFDTDPPRMAESAALRDAIETNLSQLKARGGKMIQYHGWNDTTAPPLMATNYYEGVLQFMGQAATKSFYKLYMVPGMGHCGGLTGCYSSSDANFWFLPLVDWVEKGIEPGALIGKRLGISPYTSPYFNPRTRPLCPYPKVARYLGTGSIDDAANFICAEIIPAANVRIIPARVSLSHTRKFAAVVRLPDGYKARDLEISAVVCEGAPAVKVNATGQTGIAWFNMEDVINPITPGDEVTFRVNVIANYNGQTIAFEGSDTVKVTE